MTGGVTPCPPGFTPAEPGWYVVEDDNRTRFVVQVIPCAKGLYVFETEAVDTFPVSDYHHFFVARLDLGALCGPAS